MWAFTLYYWALGQQHSLVKGTHVPRVYATACMCAHWRVLCKHSSFILMHTQEEFLPEAALHQSWWCSKWHIVAVFFFVCFFVTYYILSSCLSGVAELFYFLFFGPSLRIFWCVMWDTCVTRLMLSFWLPFCRESITDGRSWAESLVAMLFIQIQNVSMYF